MIVHRFRSQEEYAASHVQRSAAQAAWRLHEARIDAAGRGPSFTVAGLSYPARRLVDFVVTRSGATPGHPNWRETVTCPVTGLSSRLRASVHLIDSELGLSPGEVLYLTEQSTPLYRYFKSAHGKVVGSEYLGPAGRGETQAKTGLRNEDLTQLTFPNDSFDVIGCFECLEHIPNDGMALTELARALRPGGRLLMFVPFAANRVESLVRAEIGSAGHVVHHEPPEYHGDPLSSEGCLCFRHYGWDLLDRLRTAGFSDAYGVSYWSDTFCYFGAHQLMFVASK